MMLLGRSTVQWTALIVAAAGLAQVLLVTLIPEIDPVVVATIIGSVSGFLAVFIAFLANTQTTPLYDARMKAGSTVTVLDSGGRSTGDTVTIQPSPPGPTGQEDGEHMPGVSG